MTLGQIFLYGLITLVVYDLIDRVLTHRKEMKTLEALKSLPKEEEIPLELKEAWDEVQKMTKS